MPITRSTGIVLGSLFCCLGFPGVTVAAIMGYAEGNAAPIADFDSDTSTDPVFSLRAEEENDRGGHGYGMAELNFLGGIIRGRGPACVGPRDNFFSPDSAVGNANVTIQDERFFVRSGTLPVGTPVTITLCVDATSDVVSEDAGGVSGNTFAQNRFSARINSNLPFFFGLHAATTFDGSTIGDGAFPVAAADVETATGSVTFNSTVGSSFLFRLSVFSGSQTTIAATPEDPFPIAESSAGYAVRFGLDGITDGVTLEWRGVEWVGSCGETGSLVPPNPIESGIPEPTAFGLLAPAGLLLGRFRRRRVGPVGSRVGCAS